MSCTEYRATGREELPYRGRPSDLDEPDSRRASSPAVEKRSGVRGGEGPEEGGAVGGPAEEWTFLARRGMQLLKIEEAQTRREYVTLGFK